MQLRTAVGDALARVRAGAWGAAQCGLAASGAWAFSTHVLGHQRPFFASVAAVVALGLSGGGRVRRTAELAVGVALGVAIGDLLVGLLGQGSWQIGVVVFVALLLAVAVGGRGLVVTQAGLQAVFVVALPRLPHSGLHRWQDALVGGATALLVAALLPQDPWRQAQRTRRRYVEELAAVLRDTAAAVRAGSTPAVAEALARGRALEPVLTRWDEALAAGRDTARLTPFRRGSQASWDQGRRLTTGFSRASRNLRVLLRRLVVALESGHALPGALPGLLEDLAGAVLLAGTSDAAVEPLLELAGRLDPDRLEATNLSAQVVVAQLRVAVVDLLDGLGLDHDRARSALPELAS